MHDTNVTLADLAATRPGATRVFRANGLEFCCRGRRPLAEACAERGLDPTAVLQAIDAEEPSDEDLTAWAERDLGALCDHIVERYHERLRSELPELIAMARKVERVHADKAACPTGLAGLLETIHGSVLDHMEKEERILFPLIRSGRGAQCSGPVQVMEAEHDDHGANLARVRERTGDLVPPEEACTTWRALYLRLGRLEQELTDHIHLENNVLFPRALCA